MRKSSLLSRVLLFVLSSFCVAINVDAYSFEVNDIYYLINSNNPSEVSVTYAAEYDDEANGYSIYMDDVVIPETVTHEGSTYTVTAINDHAFYGSRWLSSVSLPATVRSIGASAFQYCPMLASINLPEGLESIGDCAFYQDTLLTTINIPSTVKSIQGRAFAETGLTSVTIPASTTSIHSMCFSACQHLKSIMVEAGNPVYDSRSDCNAVIETETDALLLGCKGTVIPSDVTTVGPSAFAYLNTLTEISVPASVKEIGAHAFFACRGLKSVELHDGLTTIDDYAFYLCTSLSQIHIPATVTDIGASAFWHCESLTGTLAIPPLVTMINNSTFSGCESLTGIRIHDQVTMIGDFAFTGCKGLTSVQIGSSVTDINQLAFSSCDDLTRVICLAEVPPVFNGQWPTECFSNMAHLNATLYVPEESLRYYRMANGWNCFNKIVGIDPASITCDVNGDGEVSVGDINTVLDAILCHHGDWTSDANRDNEVNMADINFILDQILGSSE